MSILSSPLRRMQVTQPFGVNYGPTADFYTKIGLKAHNGLDLSAPTGTEVLACMDGDLLYVEGGEGYGNSVRIRNRGLGLEAVYGHLMTRVAPDGPVKSGDVIALSNNTGYSTGAHLHFGVRRIEWRADGSGPYVLDYDNGYYGCIDPASLLVDGALDLPVDKGYGNQAPPSVLAFAPAFAYFLRSQRRVPSFREYRALRFGYWPLRDVLDPALFPIWSEMAYPEAVKRGLVK